MEMPGSATLHLYGEKDNTASTTGHHKERLIVILGVIGDSTKLKPIVLFPGVGPPKPCDIPLVVVYMFGAKRGSSQILKSLLAWEVNNRDRRLLVWDTFRGHTTKMSRGNSGGTSILIYCMFPLVAQAKFSQLMFCGMLYLRGIWNKRSCMINFNAYKELTRYGNPNLPPNHFV